VILFVILNQPAAGKRSEEYQLLVNRKRAIVGMQIIGMQ